MWTPKLSRHAGKRCQQRGVRPKEVAILMTYADIEIPARGGCRFLRLSHRRCIDLLSQTGLLAQQVDRVQRLVALVDREGAVVTVLKVAPECRMALGRRRRLGR
jgi:hypothetical protein